MRPAKGCVIGSQIKLISQNVTSLGTYSKSVIIKGLQKHTKADIIVFFFFSSLSWTRLMIGFYVLFDGTTVTAYGSLRKLLIQVGKL